MSQWLVMQGDTQFAVDGLGELRSLAAKGTLRAGDMIQPPGTTDWLYAVEIPELKPTLDANERQEDDEGLADRMRSSSLAYNATAAVLALISAVGLFAMFVFAQRIPTGNESLIGDGGLTYSEMIATEAAALLNKPESSGGAIRSLVKDEVLELLAKRGDYYRARAKRDGKEGWVEFGAVIPMYQLGGIEIREEYDPLYNPDRYLDVESPSWMLLPDSEKEHTTVFQFTLINRARYPMSDLVIVATIKDAKGHELEKVEIPVNGVIPAQSTTIVGTLKPDKPGKRAPDAVEEPARLLTQHTFDLMAKDDPDLQLRYSAGVEAQMSTSDFTNATIDVIELRAIPDDQAAEVVTRRAG